ncbi:MAG: hypothetical protein EA394_09695 [Bacteroidia bacterium]|nr:MAG: hypothetical protein EA394_09695 [Bacteroidia bacterium]
MKRFRYLPRNWPNFTWGRSEFIKYDAVFGIMVIFCLLFLAGCKDDDPEPITPVYQLTLIVDPPDGGIVTGAGEYKAGEMVEISADPLVSWDFEGWTGNTDFMDDTTVKQISFAMPQEHITLTANFNYFHCGDDITFTYRGEEVTYGTIERGGLCWLDRNLGADPMPFVPAEEATGNADPRLFGDLFQWGRLADGHQDRESDITDTLSKTDVPGHGDFITAESWPKDWRSPQNNDLWGGVDGANNPCPPGWRLPVSSELQIESQSWVTSNAAGAYASPLKWPVEGRRSNTGPVSVVGSAGYAWTSTVVENQSHAIGVSYSGLHAGMSASIRAGGKGVRCVRDVRK